MSRIGEEGRRKKPCARQNWVQVDRPIAKGVALRILSVVTMTNEHRIVCTRSVHRPLVVIRLPQRFFQRPVKRIAGAKRHRRNGEGFQKDFKYISDVPRR
jgi:hypothetical protein